MPSPPPVSPKDRTSVMRPNAYYLGSEEILLETPESHARLVQRLRQYLELRNLSVLVGNGCSIPLGAPVIGNVADLRPEFDATPHRLSNDAMHVRARQLLDRLLPTAGSLGVEPLLTVLAHVQANEELLGKTTQFLIH